MTSSSDEQRDKAEPRTAQLRAVLLTACVLSLAIGFCDMILGTASSKPDAFASFSGMLPPLAVTTCTCLGLYLASWVVARAVLGRRLGGRDVALAVSLAAFWALIFVTATVSDLLNLPPEMRDPWVQAKVLVCFSVSVMLAAACYRLVPASVGASIYMSIARAAGLMILSILALAVLYVWQQTYRPMTGVGGWMLFIGFVLGILFAAWIAVRVGHRMHLTAFVCALLVVVVLGPVALWVPPKKAEASLEKLGQRDHAVKRVILLSIDALRADVLSCYNDQAAATPNIDRIAADSVVFTRTRSSAPWTLPSFASIMTGLEPSVHQASRSSPRLPDALPTLAEHLRGAGYLTGAVGLNCWLTKESNMSQGFDDYNFFPPPSMGSTFGGKLLRMLAPSRFQRTPPPRDLTRLACRWLEANAGKNFFFWLHYLDPHCPYGPPEAYLPDGKPPPRIGKAFRSTIEARGGNFATSADERKWIKALYDAEVRYVDDCVGTVLDTLKRLGIYDDSLLVLMSDHGEEFWEHGGIDHGATVYEEVLRVPLMIKLPHAHSTVKRITEPVSAASITPTILDLCGIEYQAEYLSVGSLSPLLGPDPQAFEAAPIVSSSMMFFEDRQSVVVDGMKYIRHAVTGREELYDLTNDPKERVCLAAWEADKLERARAIAEKLDNAARELKSHYEQLGMDTSTAKPSEEMLRDLRSLGYVR